MENSTTTIFQPGLYLKRDKELFKIIIERLSHGEPCATVCIHGNGLEYLFLNIVKEFQHKKTPYKIKVLRTISEGELREFVEELENDLTPTMCFINLRIGQDISWFINRIDNLRLKRDHEFVSFISAYVGDVYAALKSMEKILTSSLFILERVSFEDSRNMIAELADRFNFHPNLIQEKDIYQWSYGHIALIKSLFLLKKQYPQKVFDANFLLGEPTVLQRLIGIVQDIPYEILDSLNKKSLSPLDKLFCEKFGYIENGKLFNPLLEPLIPHLPVPRNSSFSQTELTVLELLKTHKDTVISREDVARVIWGEDDWEERYSDWAIGQLIYRLRKKLEYGSSSGTIETKKGKGFVYLNKEITSAEKGSATSSK